MCWKEKSAKTNTAINAKCADTELECNNGGSSSRHCDQEARTGLYCTLTAISVVRTPGPFLTSSSSVIFRFLPSAKRGKLRHEHIQVGEAWNLDSGIVLDGKNGGEVLRERVPIWPPADWDGTGTIVIGSKLNQEGWAYGSLLVGLTWYLHPQ